MCSCFTHLAGNLGTSANSSFHSMMCHSGFISTPLFNLPPLTRLAVWFSSCPPRLSAVSFGRFCLVSLRGGSCLYLRGWSGTSGPVKVCAASWRWQPRSLPFHFSFQCHNVERWKRSDKHRSKGIVCNLGNMQLHSLVLSNVSPVGPVGNNNLANITFFIICYFPQST